MRTANISFKLSFSSVILATFIGLAFLAILGLLALAFYFSFAPEMDSLSTIGVVFALLGTLIVFLLCFSLAGWCASFIAQQHTRTGAIVHGLGSWTLLSLIFSLFSFFAVLSFVGIENFRFPTILTDIQVFKAKAVTTLSISPSFEKPNQEEKPEKNLMIFFPWATFVSILLGLPLSIFSAIAASRRNLNFER